MVTNCLGEEFESPLTDSAKFDCVLADVPCSGDGTVRKAKDVMRRWQVTLGLELHPIQLSIGLRSAQLTAVGGRFIYSTCAFNPIEDEAVVAEILRQCNTPGKPAALQLVDCTEMLPQLQRADGLSKWKVAVEQEDEDTAEPSSAGWTKSLKT